jgi:hypothetical protein
MVMRIVIITGCEYERGTGQRGISGKGVGEQKGY